MKQQIFIDDIHEYDYELSDDNLHTLYYSNGGEWLNNIKETVSNTVIDDGNGLIIRFDTANKTGIRLDYSEAERLFILLKLINSPAKYEIGTKKLL
jgi:hypothetical protein